MSLSGKGGAADGVGVDAKGVDATGGGAGVGAAGGGATGPSALLLLDMALTLPAVLTLRAALGASDPLVVLPAGLTFTSWGALVSGGVLDVQPSNNSIPSVDRFRMAFLFLALTQLFATYGVPTTNAAFATLPPPRGEEVAARELRTGKALCARMRTPLGRRRPGMRLNNSH